MTIYHWLLIFCWCIFLAYWVISALGTKGNIGGIWRWLGIRILMVIAILTLFHSQIFDQIRQPRVVAAPNPTTGAIGVILCAIGVAFAIWARVHLGKNWGMPMSVKKDPELVTSGPYAYVRHPIYTGVLLGVLGSTLVSGWSWVLLFVIFGGYFIYSAKMEEKLMAKKFPGQYPEYKRRTKMLIPFLF